MPPIEHLRKKLGLYLICLFSEMRVMSFNNVFDAESNDVTAKANIVNAVRVYITHPLENDKV